MQVCQLCLHRHVVVVIVVAVIYHHRIVERTHPSCFSLFLGEPAPPS